MAGRYVLAVHGGAGTIAPELMTPGTARVVHNGLRAALRAGQRILAAGGRAVDAAAAAVVVLEDDPQFNAGHGSVFNAAGRQEMDAAIMDGRTQAAGAVAGICGPKNPILAARAVMERSPHVMLVGEGAHSFLRAQDVAFEEEEYFQTQRRWAALQKKLAHKRAGRIAPLEDADRHGTVGAVALDMAGALAAATSTGGVTAKLPGRVGDSPLLGAGTWATKHCAISATGDGEFFMRLGVGHEIAARVGLAGQQVTQAASDVIGELGFMGGSGGVIALDAAGQLAMPFNARGMYRGMVDSEGRGYTALYRGEPSPFGMAA
jgi:isoaspartyl peptidase/L-asparaginase-like protein (Ntn-hydrolase superfamily)